jgi:hypothetical protein
MFAHALAKLAALLYLPIAYFLNNLSHSLKEIWFRDFRCIPFLV